MTVKEKQEYFYQMAIESATAQNISMTKEYEEQLAKESKEYEEQLNESYSRKLKVKKDELLRENNSKVSFKSLECRHEYNELRDQLRESLFDQVKAQVIEFCKTSEYKQKLLTQVISAVKTGVGCTCQVYVMADDYDLIANQKFADNVSIIESKEDFWGGCKVYLVEKKMVINHTFKFEFEECKQNFQFHVAKDAEVKQ